MARLNTRTSAAPLSRASTVDSLYRDPTPASRRDGPSTARPSSYSVLSPSASHSSDKENNMPVSRETTPRPKGKAPTMGSRRLQRPATPDSGSSNKRRRTGDYTSTMEANSVPVYKDEEVDLDEDVDEDRGENEDDDTEQGHAPPTPDDDDEARFYDPDQNPEERRMVSALLRDHHREVLDNRGEIEHGDGLLTHIRRANNTLGKIKQTGLAVQDSRLMVTMTDIAGKALNATLSGNNAGMGVDIDQFISRAIYFMKEGEAAGSEGAGATQPRTNRRHTQAPDDEVEEDGGDGLDWALLGRLACFPSNKRPPVPSFLLGPLSVQKRVRTTTRRARARRQPLGPATRPEEVRQEDIKQSENSNLTHLVKNIRTRLSQHIEEGASKIEEELSVLPEGPDEEDMSAAYSRHRIHVTPDEEAAVSLFDFAINPTSFGQTVENLFYISFLIREGNARVLVDSNKLPLLVPADPRSLSDQRQHNIEKHQAIFSIDWPTWKALIEAFDIQEPLIPHRATDEANASASGWRS